MIGKPREIKVRRIEIVNIETQIENIIRWIKKEFIRQTNL